MGGTRRDGIVQARRPYGTLVVETYLYKHNQQEGYVCRRKFFFRNGRILDVSKYFSESRFGSLSTAEWHARRWKNANLLGPSNRNRDGQRARKRGR